MKTVIITGASRGIGAAAARALSKLETHVVLFARSDRALGEVASDIEQGGGKAIPVAGDVCCSADLDRLVETALEHFGQIDALVNNAGIVDPIASVGEADPEAWRLNWEVNVLGPVQLIQRTLPHLRRSSGRIINVSSGFAIKPVPGLSAYCTAKAGLNHFTRTLAEEEQAITAIALRPGAVDTAMQEVIRKKRGPLILKNEFDQRVMLHERERLLSPDLPGRAIAVLALYAPHAWNGDFLSWNDEKVQELVEQHLPSSRMIS